MPTPFESAQLNLKLFELRQEPLLREARAWFFAEFNPEMPGAGLEPVHEAPKPTEVVAFVARAAFQAAFATVT